MPFDAVVERLVPPASDVAERAAANVPTVRTVAGFSTLKSVGNAAVAVVPIPSKFCVYAAFVGIDIDASATYVQSAETAAMATTSANPLRTMKRSAAGTNVEDAELGLPAEILRMIIPLF